MMMVATTAFSQTNNKVGYANMEYIISNLPDAKRIDSVLTTTRTRLRNEYGIKSQEFQKRYTDYVQNMNTLTDTTRAGIEKELQRTSGELQQFETSASQTLQNQQRLLMAPVYLKVSNVIDEVAVENGYAIILNDRFGETTLLLYAGEKEDISDLVLKKFGVTPPLKK